MWKLDIHSKEPRIIWSRFLIFSSLNLLMISNLIIFHTIFSRVQNLLMHFSVMDTYSIGLYYLNSSNYSSPNCVSVGLFKEIYFLTTILKAQHTLSLPSRVLQFNQSK